MINIRIVILSLLLSISISSLVLAQTTPNSVYNLLGVGTLGEYGVGAYKSMGNAGIGGRSASMVNLKNPAALNAVQDANSIFDAGLYVTSLYKDTGSSTESSQSGGLDNLNMWFRAGRKLGIAVGLNKFSDASYDLQRNNISSTTLGSYDAVYTGTGGIFQAYLGSGYQIGKHLNLGARVNFLFGRWSSVEEIYTDQLVYDLEVEDKRNFADIMFDFGAQYQIPLGENKSLTLGATYRPQINVNIDDENTITQNFDDDSSISSSSSSHLSVPQKAGVGIGLRWAPWNLNVDYEFEEWSINEDEKDYSYLDRYVFSLGASYQKDRMSTSYIDRVIFRAGMNVQSNYVSLDGSSYLNYGYSVGVGLPHKGIGMINIGYQYSDLGTKDNDQIFEQVHKVSVNISLKDIWFRKVLYN